MSRIWRIWRRERHHTRFLLAIGGRRRREHACLYIYIRIYAFDSVRVLSLSLSHLRYAGITHVCILFSLFRVRARVLALSHGPLNIKNVHLGKCNLPKRWQTSIPFFPPMHVCRFARARTQSARAHTHKLFCQ